MDANCYIQMEGVGCRFYLRNGLRRPQAVDALRDITFNINRIERLGIIGSNGAGKSTLLRIIARTLTPNYGKLYFHNQLRTNLVTISPVFLNNSGRENAILSCIMMGLTHKQAIEKLSQITEFAELDSWMEKPLYTYSSGMRARLGLAIGLSVESDILLIDETLSIGDQRFRQKSQHALYERMQKSSAIVMVSHNMDAIAQLCSRVVWLHKGRIMADGPCNEILEQYKKWCLGNDGGQARPA